MTERTTQELTSLEATLAEIARLTEKAEGLKWGILDRREIGAQTAVARAYGVRRQSVAQWIEARAAALAAKAEQPADDECIDGEGNPYPEHDFGEVDCRRCGAEPADDDTQDTRSIA